MSSGDEASDVLPLDEMELERLAEVLDCDGVVAAMFIEPQARGRPGPLSDVDIAAWHDPALDPPAAQGPQARLAADAAHAICANRANLVMLNRESPGMRYRAIRNGKRLVERDHDGRVRLETRAILDYLDTAPLT